MIARANNNRFKDYIFWDTDNTNVVAPYDYQREGLLKHLFVHSIYNAAVESNGDYKKTPFGQLMMYMENSMVICMKFVDRLKNFKNYAYFNR